MSLRDDLLKVPLREIAGRRTINRLNYELSWAICQLIELHDSNEDYALVMEYHDDVIVLDSPSDPKKARFYQIKTGSGDMWRSGGLWGGSSDLSILGKLALHHKSFGSSVEALHLISNKGFKLNFLGGQKECTNGSACLSQLDPAELTSLSAALQKEVPGIDVNECTKLMHVGVSTLSHDGHRPHAVGTLFTYLRSLYPNSALRLNDAFSALLDEIYRLASGEDLPTEFNALIARCGITRNRFADFLTAIRPQEEYMRMVDGVRAELMAENWTFDDRHDLELALRGLELARLNMEDVILVRAIKSAKELSRDRTRVNGSLGARIGTVASHLSALYPDLSPSRPSRFLEAIATTAIYDV